MEREAELRLPQLLGLGGLAIAMVVLVAIYLPFAIDWHLTYRPAALALLSGRSPYTAGVGYTNAPWALLPMLPLALLPEPVGRAILFVLSLAALAYTAYRLGAKPLALGAFILSPPVVNELLNGNVNWLVLLGFVMPPQIGLFLIAAKPHVGYTVAVFWLIEAWRRGRWWEVMHVFGPVSLALLISFAGFGFWPSHFGEIASASQAWNASLWPGSIPVGLVLLIVSLRKREIRYAMAASPCLSPYVLLHAWSGALVALAASQVEMIVAVIGLWVLVALRTLG